MSTARHTSIEALFHAHYRGLCGFVCRTVGSPEVAEEIVQDLFLRIWEQQERDDGPTLSKAYLYRAARNQAVDHLRRRQRDRRWRESTTYEPAAAVPGADAGQGIAELQGAIEAAVGRLPPRCREIFLLHRQQELSYADIAETLGVSIKTVETQMGRALKSLRTSLADFLTLAGIFLLSR